MAQARFYLKAPDQRGLSLIVAKMSYGKKRFQYSLSQNIPPDHWDVSISRAKSSYPAAKELNRLLDQIVAELERTKLNLQSQRKPVNNKALRAAMDEFFNKSVGNSANYNLVSFAEKIAEERPNPTTYRNLVPHLKDFIRRHQYSADFSEIDYSFFRDFERYLQRQELAWGYVYDLMRRFKTIMKESRKRKIHNNREIDDLDILTKNVTKDKITLTFDEVRQLYQFEFKDKKLSRARDCLVAACLTGLRYNDWDKIDKKSELEPVVVQTMTFIEIPVTGKTSRRLFVPVLDYTDKILERNNGKIPVISQQKSNEYIKEAAKTAGLTQKVSIGDPRGTKVKTEVKERWEAISTHTGRRTWAGFLRDSGMPDSLIQMLVGWKGKGMADRYDRRDFERIAESIVPYLQDIEKRLYFKWDGTIRQI